MSSLVAAVRFLTRLPLPGRPTTVEDLSRAVGWFPLVGGLVGFFIAGLFVAACQLWPAYLAAALAVGFGLLLTGGFHEDGFSDSLDGLGGGLTKERTLEIMKDSRIGAYGAMGLWVILTVRWACLVSLRGQALWIFPLAMVWGRFSISLMLRALNPIAAGLAKEVHRDLRRGPLALSTLILLLANVLAFMLGRDTYFSRALLVAALAALLVTAFWILYLRRRLGGYSGDLLGAGNQLVEIAFLLALVRA